MNKTAAPAPAPVIDMDALPPSGGSYIRNSDGTLVPAPAPAPEQDTPLTPISPQPPVASE